MVGIMKKGELVALGSPLELKTQHGTALQFSVLVEKSEIQRTVSQIREHFKTANEWIDLKFSDAGNITVTIKKIQEKDSRDGIDVSLLTSFVRWLESDASNVSEYGFSNSSLEEVFLKLTHEEHLQGASDATVVESQEDEAGLEPEQNRTTDITSYQPKVTLGIQVLALFRHFLRLNWLGKRSRYTWIAWLFAVGLVMFWGFFLAQSYYNGAGPLLLIWPVIFVSLILVNVTSTVYWDRNEGLIYYMRSQGLLLKSYLVGIGFYSFWVYFIYAFVLLSLFFATPMFREPTLCSDYDCQENRKRTEPPVISSGSFSPVDYDTGDEAVLYAYIVPGGYGKMYMAILFFASTGPGVSFFLSDVYNCKNILLGR